jgi:hypothetical protein
MGILGQMDERQGKKGATEEAKDGRVAEQRPEVVGGFAFYLSLAALLPTGLLLTFLTLLRVGEAEGRVVAVFVCSILGGAIISHFTIAGHLSVLIHEFKHSLVSNLVGNRHKGMKINQASGYYQYSYTKQTAHYNAFISMAPYIVPVFTFVGTLIAIALFRNDRDLSIMVVGLGYGIDLVLNMRDISPIQTDISLIRGGFFVGLLYIGSWNVMILSMLCTWVLHGPSGLLQLTEDIARVFVNLYIRIVGHPTP